MSYQRAVVNCRICHALANSEISANVIRDSETDLQEDLEKSGAREARERAMQALEEEMSRVASGNPDVLGLSDPAKHYAEGDMALLDCMHCEYKKPEIAERFDPEDAI